MLKYAFHRIAQFNLVLAFAVVSTACMKKQVKYQGANEGFPRSGTYELQGLVCSSGNLTEAGVTKASEFSLMKARLVIKGRMIRSDLSSTGGTTLSSDCPENITLNIVSDNGSEIILTKSDRVNGESKTRNFCLSNSNRSTKLNAVKYSADKQSLSLNVTGDLALCESGQSLARYRKI